MKILILLIFFSLISKNLTAYQEISIQKDNSLMNYEDILNSINSSVAQQDIQEYIDKNIYNINFSSEHISFDLDFENPMELSRVSSGQSQDYVLFQVKSNSYFVSKDSGIILKAANIINGFSQVIPRQLPKGVIEKDIKNAAKAQENTLKIIIIILAIF